MSTAFLQRNQRHDSSDDFIYFYHSMSLNSRCLTIVSTDTKEKLILPFPVVKKCAVFPQGCGHQNTNVYVNIPRSANHSNPGNKKVLFFQGGCFIFVVPLSLVSKYLLCSQLSSAFQSFICKFLYGGSGEF